MKQERHKCKAIKAWSGDSQTSVSRCPMGSLLTGAYSGTPSPECLIEWIWIGLQAFGIVKSLEWYVVVGFGRG